MAKPILADDLWALIEPLLPAPKRRRKRYPGRKPIANRQALTGILYVLRSGVLWNLLPKEMGCGSGKSCWRRLKAWQRAGVWDRLHKIKGATQFEERLVNFGETLESDTKASELMQPSNRALYDPAGFAQATAMFGVAASSFAIDAALGEQLAQGFGIVSAISFLKAA